MMGYGNGAVQAGANYMPTPQMQAQRLPVIASELSSLEGNAVTLNELITELAARIEAALSPEPPQGTAGREVQPTHGAKLGASLSNVNGALQSACARLRSMIDRVEL